MLRLWMRLSVHTFLRYKEVCPAKKCLDLGKPGYFPVHEGFQLKTPNQSCSEAEHPIDDKLTALLRKKQKPFKMKNLLKVDQTAIEPFEDSAIKKNMLS